MKLAAESHARIEAFHRGHSKDTRLRLPAVYIYDGSFSRWITKKFDLNAITFGRHVFLDPDLIEDAGVKRAPGWLIAHETAHVLQYERAGFIGFLIKFLWDFLRAWRKLGWKMDEKTRLCAYHSMRVEQEALAVEHAFRQWKDESLITEDESS